MIDLNEAIILYELRSVLMVLRSYFVAGNLNHTMKSTTSQ